MRTDTTSPDRQISNSGREVTAEHISILLVEDNQIVTNLLKDVLESEGWLVESHKDGVSALLKLENSDRYDLILTDNDMPGICGFELIRRVRALPHRQQTPIIMLSANAYQAEAIHAGADAFLRKPEDVFAIPQTISRLLGIGIKEFETRN